MMNRTDKIERDLLGSFNPLFYLHSYPDVAAAGVDPVEHYLQHGIYEGRTNISYSEDNIILICIMKMESKYLLEWIAYHRNEGIRNFIIGDNGENDEQTTILESLERKNIIQRVDICGQSEAQIPFYNKILNSEMLNDMIAGFIDADEFLVSNNGELSAGNINKLFDRAFVGAVGINWATYGSGFHLDYAPGLVINRFQYRSERDFANNKHIKTFVRIGAANSFAGNPHAVMLNQNLRYVNAEGNEISWDSDRIGITEEVIWDPIRINHYTLKSRQEFFQKRLRGYASTPRHMTLGSFFDDLFRINDRNECHEPFELMRISAVKSEILRLQNLISDI